MLDFISLCWQWNDFSRWSRAPAAGLFQKVDIKWPFIRNIYQGVLIAVMMSRQNFFFFFFSFLQVPTLTMEGGRLKKPLNLMAGQDFETVPEPVWRALYHWYGANLSLPRPVCVPVFISGGREQTIQSHLSAHVGSINPQCFFEPFIKHADDKPGH